MSAAVVHPEDRAGETDPPDALLALEYPDGRLDLLEPVGEIHLALLLGDVLGAAADPEDCEAGPAQRVRGEGLEPSQVRPLLADGRADHPGSSPDWAPDRSRDDRGRPGRADGVHEFLGQPGLGVLVST